ncbi:hypothetical protein CHISP_2781 [Chitinispirillum alkaliphilum]|nr:hypothetical protein CHISP_2781 [Chitinispirillum alkaliphilum]
MIPILIAILLALFLIIIAVKVGMNKEECAEPTIDNLYARSGIYSVIRKTPRENLLKVRPSEEEIRKYLQGINVDICELPVSDSEKDEIVDIWKRSINSNVEAIEQGDQDGVEFYFYDFPQTCPGCEGFVSKGQYVSREEIYRHPVIIPPFHLGCNCQIKPHSGSENLRETTETGFRPFFDDYNVPALPEWTSTVKVPDTQKANVDENLI